MSETFIKIAFYLVGLAFFALTIHFFWHIRKPQYKPSQKILLTCITIGSVLLMIGSSLIAIVFPTKPEAFQWDHIIASVLGCLVSMTCIYISLCHLKEEIKTRVWFLLGLSILTMVIGVYVAYDALWCPFCK